MIQCSEALKKATVQFQALDRADKWLEELNAANQVSNPTNGV